MRGLKEEAGVGEIRKHMRKWYYCGLLWFVKRLRLVFPKFSRTEVDCAATLFVVLESSFVAAIDR